MNGRRFLSLLLVLGGAVLLAAAGLHYFRGYEAQSEGRRAWGLMRASNQLPARPPQENPGISAPNLPPATAANELPYPWGKPVARLRIPSAEIDTIVFGGADNATLEKGPGHVPGSELPGEETGRKNCVITAHRDSHFRHLGWLRKGHRLSLETPAGKTLDYRVVSREIVKPDDVRVLQPTTRPRVTLITCYPFNYVGAAPKRLVVVAEPVSRHPS
jgi:LPXTG-site transpeptidase (sortase) family protein